jgi:outer membrane lipoprotein-sorting protein
MEETVMSTKRNVQIKRKSTALFAAVLLFAVAGHTVSAQSTVRPSAEEIIRRLEENIIHDTARMEAEMVVHDRFGEKRTTMNIYQEGRVHTLIEYTSREERGQKVLRTQDEVYLYYPDAAELIRLQGAALRQSMLGSDISYEDVSGNKTILETYDVKFIAEEQVGGRPTYKLELTAVERNVAYPKQIMWIDRERYVILKSDMYSLSGRKIKEIATEKVAQIDGAWIPVVETISDTLKSNSYTEFILQEIKLNVQLPRNIFSLEQLSW